MMRVISSPSSSTTGLATFILGICKTSSFWAGIRRCYSRQKMRGQTGRKGGQTAPSGVVSCRLAAGEGNLLHVPVVSAAAAAKHVDVVEAITNGPVLPAELNRV